MVTKQVSLGWGRALIGMVLRPRRTQVGLKSALRAWWGVPLLMMLLITVVAAFVESRADAAYVYRLQLDFYAAHPEHSPGSGGIQMPSLPLMTVLIRIAGRVMLLGLNWLAWAGALSLVCLLLGQRDVGFGLCFKVTAWSWMPYVVRGLLQCLYMFLLRDPIYNPGLSGLVFDQSPPPLGVYTYTIPTQTQQVLVALLSRVDVYLFWHLLLVVLGLQTFIALPRKKAIKVGVGIWLLWVLASMVPGYFYQFFSRIRFW